MKASKMTNEELASFLEDVTWGEQKVGDSFIREAAARLRRPTPVDDDLLKMANDVDKLRAKLKVAENALESAWMYADKLPHQWPLPERVRTKMRDALAAIREPVTDRNRPEGGASLRTMLREACIEMCHDCPSCSGPGEDRGYRCVAKAGACFVQKWRVAVGMNGGES